MSRIAALVSAWKIVGGRGEVGVITLDYCRPDEVIAHTRKWLLRRNLGEKM